MLFLIKFIFNIFSQRITALCFTKHTNVSFYFWKCFLHIKFNSICME